jgi:integrase
MNEETYTMLFTLALTGLKAGELVALKWKDIDFEEKAINITKTYYNPSNNTKQFHLLPPKTSGSIRKITVKDEVINVLKRHQVRQKAVKLEDGREILYAILILPYLQKLATNCCKLWTVWVTPMTKQLHRCICI